MARRSRNTVLRQAPKRKLIWARNLGVQTLTGGTNDAVDLLANFNLTSGIAFAPPGTTVTRILISMGIVRTAGVVVTPVVFNGIIVGPSTLDSVDINPISDNHLDWMYWRKHYVRTDSAAHQTLVDIDVKAQRKMEELQSTLWFASNGTPGDSYSLSWGSSVLLKLP